MTAKSNKERQAALKARRKAAGLVPVTVWVYPENRQDVKRLAETSVWVKTGWVLESKGKP